MKKLITLFLLFFSLCLISSCYFGLPEPKKGTYAVYVESFVTEFANLYPEMSEEDYILGIFVGDGYPTKSPKAASFLSADDLYEMGIISIDDSELLKEYKDPADDDPLISKYFCVMYAMINNELKVICMPMYYPYTFKEMSDNNFDYIYYYYVFDCLNDFGLLEKIEEFSDTCGFDVKEHLKERSIKLFEEVIQGRGNSSALERRYIRTESIYYPILIENANIDEEDMILFIFAETGISFDIAYDKNTGRTYSVIDDEKCEKYGNAIHYIYDEKNKNE